VPGNKTTCLNGGWETAKSGGTGEGRLREAVCIHKGLQRSISLPVQSQDIEQRVFFHEPGEKNGEGGPGVREFRKGKTSRLQREGEGSPKFARINQGPQIKERGNRGPGLEPGEGQEGVKN